MEGRNVAVFTDWPNYPTGRLFGGYEMTRLTEKRVDGIQALRSFSMILPNTSFHNHKWAARDPLSIRRYSAIADLQLIAQFVDYVLAARGS